MSVYGGEQQSKIDEDADGLYIILQPVPYNRHV